MEGARLEPRAPAESLDRMDRLPEGRKLFHRFLAKDGNAVRDMAHFVFEGAMQATACWCVCLYVFHRKLLC